MGNNHSTAENRSENSSSLHNNHRKQQDGVGTNSVSIATPSHQRAPIPTCPICFINDPNYIKFDTCGHIICHACFQVYVKGILKDIAAYPIKCYEKECDTILTESQIRYALSSLNNDNHDFVTDMRLLDSVGNLAKLEADIKVWEKFSVLCTMNPNEREECPKCSMIYFIPQRWSNDDVLNKFHWINDNETKKCHNCTHKSKNSINSNIFNNNNNNNNNSYNHNIGEKRCNVSSFTLFTRRHHCRVCGSIFCDDCSSKEVPLKACSNEMILKHFKIKTAIISTLTQEQLENDNYILTLLTLKQREMLNDDGTLVRCCDLCWLRYYRVICSEINCNFEYCRHCKIAWKEHFDDINSNSSNNNSQFIDCQKLAISKEKSRQTHLDNKNKTDNYFSNQDYRRCPGCGIWVSKITGCNHMTHEGCSNPLPKDIDNKEKETHFCYCCGEILYKSSRKYEKDGTLHFVNGVFEPCRKYVKKKHKFWFFGSRNNSNNNNNNNNNNDNNNDNNNNNDNTTVIASREEALHIPYNNDWNRSILENDERQGSNENRNNYEFNHFRYDPLLDEFNNGIDEINEIPTIRLAQPKRSDDNGNKNTNENNNNNNNKKKKKNILIHHDEDNGFYNYYETKTEQEMIQERDQLNQFRSEWQTFKRDKRLVPQRGLFDDEDDQDNQQNNNFGLLFD